MTLYELQPGLPLPENYRAISHAQIDLAIDSLSAKKKRRKRRLFGAQVHEAAARVGAPLSWHDG